MTHPAESVDWRLYLVTDSEMAGGRDRVPAVVREAVLGGVGVVQVRDKQATDAQFHSLACRLLDVLGQIEADTGRHVPLFVNDRAEIAADLGVHLHVGQSDSPLARARDLLGPDPMIGLSIERPEQLDIALAEAERDLALLPAAIGVGPVWATPTKTDAAQPLGLGGLNTVARRASRAGIAAVGIGGVNVTTAAAVARTGAGLCVVSAIMAAPDPRGAASGLLGLWNRENRVRKREGQS